MGRQAVRPEGLKTEYERAFIALVPDQDSLMRLAAYSASCSAAMPDEGVPSRGPEVKRYEPADLHMTLAFLGGISASQAAAILAELAHMVFRLPTLTCIGEAWWPNSITPRVHVIRYGQPPALKTLFEAVQLLVKTQGMPVDNRPFRPHITLARVKAILPNPTDNLTSRTLLNVRMKGIGLFCKSKEGSPLRYRLLGQVPIS